MRARKTITLLVSLSLPLAIAAPTLAQGAGEPDRPAGWTTESHSSDAGPNYEIVFPQDAVNTITLTVSSENWQALLDDMTALYGEFGAHEGQGAGMGGPRTGEGVAPPDRGEIPAPGEFPEGMQPPEGFEPPADGEAPRGFAPPGGMDFGGMLGGIDQNPIWIPVNLTFEGQTWTNVGFRLKGNSSLSSTWGSGIWKLPFKLDFDQFEDAYPEIKNQRFYGFKQLSFSSNWSDASLLREKAAADIFREAGVPAAQTAFYAVYLDTGEGPVYFGLYTAVEVIEDTLIASKFADDSGNVYKPEGQGATFAAGTFDEASFDKETNRDAADYSDILALFDALHTGTRTTDPDAWRAGLEAVFNVDGFLRWLAVNTVIQNWDSYGQMAHNYYLYSDPTTGLITWIPWDHNMSMMAGMRGGPERSGQARGFPGGGASMPLDLESVGSGWPLIRFLMDDPTYHARYVTYVEETIDGAFEPEKVAAMLQAYHDLIAPYVVGENGEQEGYTHLHSAEEFESALDALIAHVNERAGLAREYLAAQRSAE